MTNISGHPVDIFISLSLRCPYQAKVIKMLEKTNITMVQIPFIFSITMNIGCRLPTTAFGLSLPA